MMSNKKAHSHQDTPFTLKALLKIFTVFLCIYRFLVISGGIYYGLFHLNKYTYWNYTFLWFFDMFLLLGIIVEGKFLRYLILAFYPIVHGSNFLVFFIIIIIIQLDGWILIEETVFGVGDFTIGDLHTGDYFVHVMPLIEHYLLLLFGLLFYVRAVLRIRHNTYNCCRDHATGYGYGFCIDCILGCFDDCDSSNGSGNGGFLSKWAYLPYWIFSPLLGIICYSMFFDPIIEYPTGLPRGVCILIVLVVCIVYMGASYLLFTVSADFSVNLGGKFYAKQSHLHATHCRSNDLWLDPATKNVPDSAAGEFLFTHF